MAAKVKWIADLPKGHRIGLDKYQWIIDHPHGCKNASGHATYIKMDYNVPWELARCGIDIDIEAFKREWRVYRPVGRDLAGQTVSQPVPALKHAGGA